MCGFPTALAIEGLRTAKSPPPPTRSDAREPGDGVPRPRVHAAPPPEAELTNTLGRGLRERIELYAPLGRDCPDVTNEMCEAALSEASGRVSEALEVLRAAQGRLDRQAKEAIRRRWESAADRKNALERTGIQIDLGDPAPGTLAADPAEEASDGIRRLVSVEGRLAKFESDWKGTQGLLAQIETLRHEATELGIALEEVPSEIDQIREKLSSGPLRAADLDAVAQRAAGTLMLLHEMIPTSLEQELGRHGESLDKLPDDDSSGEKARKLHEDAGRHLAKGRLLEAGQSVRDLRRAIVELEHPSAPPAPKPRADPPPPPDEAALDVLLKKARSLAGRVRTLPTDSPLALEAAAQIREATDLLRAGRMADADRTLTELMRALSREQERR